jgi:hypothetical protein
MSRVCDFFGYLCLLTATTLLLLVLGLGLGCVSYAIFTIAAGVLA